MHIEIVANPQTGEAIYQFVNPETNEITQYSHAEYIEKRDQLLIDWQLAQHALSVAKDREMELRKLAVSFMHDPAKSGKTENVELGNGYKAKMKVPLRYGFVKRADDDRIDKAKIENALQRIEQTGPVGALIADRVVKWTPDLSLTEYNQMPDDLRAIIDEVIVTSEGSPTLEIVEPKTKK